MEQCVVSDNKHFGKLIFEYNFVKTVSLFRIKFLFNSHTSYRYL